MINYRTTADWGKRARELAGGSLDHVVEVGGQATLPQSLRAVRAGGTISLISVLAGGSMDARLGLVVTRHVRLQGITVGNRDDFRAMAQVIGQGGLEAQSTANSPSKTCTPPSTTWRAAVTSARSSSA
ncbi:MAG: zinc-binding dehydrogenase [Rhodospirillales bacterium]